MATALTTQAAHHLQNGTSASLDRSNSFGASIVAGLAMYGLATSGLCVAALTRPCMQVPKVGLVAAR
jgi:hypothetical protein